MDIPILDCSEFIGVSTKTSFEKSSFEKFVKHFGDGIRDVGILYLINHGLQGAPIENLFAKSRDFFELPKDIKAKYKKLDPINNYHGYTSEKDEKTGSSVRKFGEEDLAKLDFKEAFDFYGSDAYVESKYPVEILGLKSAVDNFRTPILELGKKVLRCLAIYLGLQDEDYFISLHQSIDDSTIQTTISVKTNYYFPLDSNFEVPNDDVILRLGEHHDIGTLTFLFQDGVSGLEYKASSGDWMPVKPIENAIIVNAGFMLEIWSGGRLNAVKHRVRLLNDTSRICRQSLVCFMTPDPCTVCKPILPKLSNWKPSYDYDENETFIHFLKRIVRKITY